VYTRLKTNPNKTISEEVNVRIFHVRGKSLDIHMKAMAAFAPAGFAPFEPHLAVRPVTTESIPAQEKVPQSQISLLPTEL